MLLRGRRPASCFLGSPAETGEAEGEGERGRDAGLAQDGEVPVRGPRHDGRLGSGRQAPRAVSTPVQEARQAQFPRRAEPPDPGVVEVRLEGHAAPAGLVETLGVPVVLHPGLQELFRKSGDALQAAPAHPDEGHHHAAGRGQARGSGPHARPLRHPLELLDAPAHRGLRLFQRLHGLIDHAEQNKGAGPLRGKVAFPAGLHLLGLELLDQLQPLRHLPGLPVEVTEHHARQSRLVQHARIVPRVTLKACVPPRQKAHRLPQRQRLERQLHKVVGDVGVPGGLAFLEQQVPENERGLLPGGPVRFVEGQVEVVQSAGRNEPLQGRLDLAAQHRHQPVIGQGGEGGGQVGAPLGNPALALPCPAGAGAVFGEVDPSKLAVGEGEREGDVPALGPAEPPPWGVGLPEEILPGER